MNCSNQRFYKKLHDICLLLEIITITEGSFLTSSAVFFLPLVNKCTCKLDFFLLKKRSYPLVHFYRIGRCFIYFFLFSKSAPTAKSFSLIFCFYIFMFYLCMNLLLFTFNLLLTHLECPHSGTVNVISNLWYYFLK